MTDSTNFLLQNRVNHIKIVHTFGMKPAGMWEILEVFITKKVRRTSERMPSMIRIKASMHWEGFVQKCLFRVQLELEARAGSRAGSFCRFLSNFFTWTGVKRRAAEQILSRRMIRKTRRTVGPRLVSYPWRPWGRSRDLTSTLEMSSVLYKYTPPRKGATRRVDKERAIQNHPRMKSGEPARVGHLPGWPAYRRACSGPHAC